MKLKPTSSPPSTIVIDVDGTLCPVKPSDALYSELEPYAEVVERLRQYRARGFRIALYTSRNMRTHSGNIGVINALTAPELVDWLRRWDIPFDELHVGKPWPGESGFYVDDRAVRPAEFLTMSYEALVERMRRDRPGKHEA